jgi:eukaryotic-like serine/threonine-protein kinase
MLESGTKLDRFEIRSLLGAGGMGEVYRAHDSRLCRDVALKLLPPDFLRDSERRARFERETQVLASLNHPNIAALYEAVAVPDSHVLVMELVEGDTLSERIAQGALPVHEALGIAVQIAQALEAAHEQGIVHRDLKPGNVKLRSDGTVKLLDFGLAKVFDPVSGVPLVAADVTVTAFGPPGAATGRVLGSPACMSPEQARGMPVDKRTDVWAFGCLLYEMLCGARAFAGDQASDVIAKILEREPDLSALPAELPASIHRLLRRCLAKDPRQRLRDIGDARLELQDALANGVRPSSRRSWWLSAGGAALLAGCAAWLVWQRDAVAPPLPVTRFTIPQSGAGGGIAISADGNQVAYVTGQGLMVRALNRLDARMVAATNLVQGNPFFSPDGLWLGFKGWDALRKVPVAGGEPATLVDRIFPVGTWSGTDIYYGDTRGLFRIPAAGGEPEKLATTEGVEQIVSVELLPGRMAVLFTVTPTRGNVPGMAASLPSARIEALDLKTGRRLVVLRGGGRPRVTRTGHLLYVSGGTLNAVGFDMEQLQVRGEAVPVIQGAGLLDFDISPQGTLVYQVASAAGQGLQMVWVDRQGREELLGAPPMPYLYPRISPDGKRVAVDVRGNDAIRDVWIWDLRRATLEMFTKDPSGNPIAAWSPDGRHLVFGSERSGVSNVYRQAADGSGEPEHLIDSEALQMPISYTPDGRLLVSVGVAGQQRDIYLMTLDGKRSISPLIHSKANELTAEVSPDGRWITYDSDESGQFEVYVRPFPDVYGGSRWQVSAAGGRQPLWSRDGRELFYRDFSGALMSMPVTAGRSFTPGRPVTALKSAGYSGAGASGGGRTYDVSRDGRRFLMLKGTYSQASDTVVVLNWFEELRRLAPLD